MSSLDTLQVDDSIQLEQQGGILTLWLNRPESRNAMSLNMVNAIQQIFAHIAEDTSIRAESRYLRQYEQRSAEWH